MKSCRTQMTLKCIFFCIVLVFAAQPHTYAESSSAKDLEQLDFANGLFQRNLYQMAIDEYNKFISAFPDSQYQGEAHFGIAECYLFMEKYKTAIEHYQKYIKLFPDQDKVGLSNLRIGQSQFLLGEYDQAFAQLQSIDISGLNEQFHPNYYYYIGKTYQTRSDNAKALEFLQKTADFKGDNQFSTPAYFEMADIKVLEGQYKEAIPIYQQAYKSADTDELKGLALFKQGEMQFSLGEYAKSIEIFRQVLKDFPEQDITKDALANILLGFFNLSQFQELVQEYENNKTFAKEESDFFNVHFTAAGAYVELKQYETADDLLNKMIKFESLSEENNHKLRMKIAEVFVKGQRYDKALRFINQKLKDSPKDKDQILFFQAESFYGKEEYQKAIEIYETIVNKYSTSGFLDDALYGIGHAYNGLKDDTKAMESFVVYFEKGEDYLKRQQALYNAILMAIKLELTDKAIELGELYLFTFEAETQNKKVLFLLGTLYPKKDNYTKAVDVFKQYVERFDGAQDTQEVKFHIAYNLQLAGKVDEAIQYYKEVAQEKDDSKFYYSSLKNMGLLYLKQNKQDEALAAFDRIITEFKKSDLDFNTYLWVAEKYLSKRKYEDVLRILARAEEEYPKSKNETALTYYKAEAHRGNKDFENAIVQYEKILKGEESNKYFGASQIGKGISLVGKNELDGARKEFEQAIEGNVGDNTITMKARFEIGNIERQKNNLEEAAKFYMLVAVLYQNKIYCPKALYSAGEIFEELKQPDQALNVYQEIIDVYAESEFFEKAKSKVESLREG